MFARWINYKPSVAAPGKPRKTYHLAESISSWVEIKNSISGQVSEGIHRKKENVADLVSISMNITRTHPTSIRTESDNDKRCACDCDLCLSAGNEKSPNLPSLV